MKLNPLKFIIFRERRSDQTVRTVRACIKAVFSIFIGLGIVSCQQKPSPVFERLPAHQTGIHFNNVVDEEEKNNVNTYLNIYTGGGRAAVDIKNACLTDLFLSGQVSGSRLYLNKRNIPVHIIPQSSGIL